MKESTPALPLLAIVGRPNVGKSTLFNRLTRTRRSIVSDEPGITRDRIYGETEWRSRRLAVVDTGGVLPGDDDIIPDAIFRQAKVAIKDAVAVLMVVDGRSDLTQPDLELARHLIRTGKPVLMLVNKIDTPRLEHEAARFYPMGLQEIFPVSAENGTGLDAVLDRVLELASSSHPAAADKVWPETEPEAKAEKEPATETKIAIVGRPNVGKSTLLNRLIGEERSIVSEIPGTTRDAVDVRVEKNGVAYRFIDTAGIRRKGVTRLMAEKLSVVMARKHLEQADIAFIVLDGAAPEEGGVLALDATIAGYAFDAACSSVIVVNKWDAARTGRRTQGEIERRIRERLKFLSFAPIVFVSAQQGSGIGKLMATVTRVSRERNKRVPTAALNRFLGVSALDRAPVPSGQRMKVYYMSQVAVAPPQFMLFVDRARKMHFAFRRYLENQLRRTFGFEGTPILIRVRKSRG